MENENTEAPRYALIVEFITIFAVVPALLAFRTVEIPLMPIITVAGILCLVYLLFDKDFERPILYRVMPPLRSVFATLLCFLIFAVLLTLTVMYFSPSIFLSFPKRNFELWCLVMLLYPVASVYPQEVLCRAFLFRRYRKLFRTEGSKIIVSAIAFSYMHIVFMNPVAVMLSLAGGLLFAVTYAKTKSLLWVSVEHSLYGMLIFTLGLGKFFYGATTFTAAYISK